MVYAGIIAHGAKGDGVADDTAAIQSALNDGSVVVFPPGIYLVSAQISIPSNRYLKFLPGASMVRKSGTGLGIGTNFNNCNFFANSDPTNGNENITIEGGLFDGNRANQTPINWQAPGNLFGGVGMRFLNVNNLRLSGMTFKDGISVQIQVGNITNFKIEDITTIYTGEITRTEVIHVNGPATWGVFRDLRDTGLSDSIVALNANDDTCGLMSEGDIQYIEIENLSRTGVNIEPYVGHAVMFLNSSSSIKDVTVRGIRGPGWQAESVVEFRALEGPPTGIIDRVVIADCDVSTPRVNDAFCYCSLNLGSLSLINNRWHVGSGTADVARTSQCFFQQDGGTIENLMMNGNQIIHHRDTTVAPILISGTVNNFMLANTIFTRDAGISAGGYLVDAVLGNINLLSVNGAVCSNLTGLINATAQIQTMTVSGIAGNPAV